MAKEHRPAPQGAPAGHRLAESSSVYLRGAAEQAISWRPWGDDPFTEAKRSRRPILLDIGAAWCHWCHVMDEGTYSDPEVARLIEQHFIAVKVDRDEHPEVDRRYQRQVSALTGEGGWPLTAFLTPEGEVFLGGTYFPPQDGHGRPGFRRVLQEVARLWRDEPEQVRQNAEAVRAALGRMARSPAAAATPGEEALPASVRADLAQRYDPVNGGFGSAPKFPHPTAISFLLLDGFRTGEERSADRARTTLLKMAEGGMYDHLGGGFHRYSVDEGWHIPHFEKMGVDNAALLEAYVEGARRFGGETRFLEVIRETVGWVRGVLGDPAGGFGSSQDADNAPGDDGSYFTWSRAELKALLEPEELRLITRYYGVGSEGRMPHDPDRNVLFHLLPLSEAAEGTGRSEEEALARLHRAKEKLRAARAQRPTPLVDRALYASLNGAFLRGLARGGQFLGDPSLVADARRAADRFLRDGFRRGEGVAHRLSAEGPSGWGLLDDQAEFALGLIDLGTVTAEPRYLESAEAILEVVRREFPGDSGVLRDVAPALYDGPRVAPIDQPAYPLEDTPHLAANAATLLAYARLAAVTGSAGWRTSAEELGRVLTARVGGAGLFAAGTALGAGLLQMPATRVVVEGSGPEADRLWQAAVRLWHPNLAIFRGLPPPPFSLPEEFARASGATGTPRALVCFGSRCLAPITEPAELARAVASPPS